MPATALFGSSAAGPGSTGGNKHLIEMRAGKMNLKGRMVYPDKRKGLLYVYQSEDSLMHFCWQDRTTGVIEDDLIIFPDDCEYVKVPQCTTGRVYLLKFKSSNRKFFFWLQEPNADKDEDHCKRINEYLNNPSGAVQNQGNTDSDLQSLLNNMSQSQLMQLFGGGQMSGLSSLLGTITRPSAGSARTPTATPASITHRTAVPSSTPAAAAGQAAVAASTPTGPSAPAAAPGAPRATRAARTTTPYAETTSSVPDGGTTAAATPTTTTPAAAAAAGNPIQLPDLQRFLQDLSLPSAPGSGPKGPEENSDGATAAPAPSGIVDLSTALTSDSLSGLIGNPDVLQQLQGHLPAVDGNIQEQLRSTLASPQFQQAVSQFSSALESGQLAPVVSQLAVNPEAISAAAQGNMQEFLKALEKNGEKSVEKEKKDPPAKKEDKKDDDEGMQLD